MAPKSPTSPGRRKSSAISTRRRSSNKQSSQPPTPQRQSRSSSTRPIKAESLSPDRKPDSPSSSPPPFQPIERARQPTPPWMNRKSWDFGPEAFAGRSSPGRYRGERKRSSGISPKGRAASEGSSRRSSQKSPRKSVTFSSRSTSKSFSPTSPPAVIGAGGGLSPSGGSFVLPTARNDSSPNSPSAQCKKSKSNSPTPPPAPILRPQRSPSESRLSPLRLKSRSSSLLFPTSPPWSSGSRASPIAKAGSKSPSSPSSKRASVYSPSSPPAPQAALPKYSPTRPGAGLRISARSSSSADSPRVSRTLVGNRAQRSPGLRSRSPYVADDEREEGELDEPTPRTLRKRRVNYYSSSSGSGSKSSSRPRSRSRSSSQPPASYPRVGFQRRSTPFIPSSPPSSSSPTSGSRSSDQAPTSPLSRLFKVINGIWNRNSPDESTSASSSSPDLSRDQEIWESLFAAANAGYRALVERVQALLDTHGVHHLLALLAQRGSGGEDAVFRTQWRFALRHVGEPEDGEKEVEVEEAVVLTRMLLDEVVGLAAEIPRPSVDDAVRRWEVVLARFTADAQDGLVLDQETRLQFEDAIYSFIHNEGFYAFVELFIETHPGEASYLLSPLLGGQNGNTATRILYAPSNRLFAHAIVGVILGDEDVEPLRANAAGETVDAVEWADVLEQEIEWLGNAEDGAEERAVQRTESEVESLAMIEEMAGAAGVEWVRIYRLLREHIRVYGLETLMRQIFTDLSAPVAEALHRDPRAAALSLGRLTPTRYDPEDNIAALIADDILSAARDQRDAHYPRHLIGSWQPPRGADANNWARRVIGGLRHENEDLLSRIRDLDAHYEAHRRTVRRYEMLASEGWLDALRELDLSATRGARSRRGSAASAAAEAGSRRSSTGSKRRRGSSVVHADDGDGDGEGSLALVRSRTPEGKRRRRATGVVVGRGSVGGSVEGLGSEEEEEMEEQEEEQEEEAEEEEMEVERTGLRRSKRIAERARKNRKR
ncbi:hypothetical protein EJ03DRAFT_350852 [Teratosphaeria nubilosa]|uniref:Uncharacterized protein n=1 Tax=Teratosphaeria nubilosa TaxID=161662 RepID=A0A6G1LB19_9PEZI|nr:hypothetical protein EJ03DRAFT_350852 [Teratosphaeria nubilosa]